MARKRNAGQSPGAATLTALKRHCHIDHNDDDQQLEQLYAAAVEYMDGAGVPTPAAGADNAARYQLCVFSLVNDWYDGTATTGACTVGLRQLINQLKASSPAIW